MLKSVKEKDLELYNIVKEEYERQNTGIEMIASESFVPTQVMELQGSILTNKTMEGFPGNRYHSGHQAIDKMEALGIERAKKLFGAEHANIQPHSGSQANQCVYASIINPGDTIMGMRLDQGGHLTHGAKVSLSGKMYNAVSYGLDKETERIDYEEMERMAKEHMPKVIVAGASSYPREIDYQRISKIAKSVGAYFLVDMAHIAGLVAADILPSPVPYADFVTSTSTKTLAGARGGFILCKKEYAKKIDKAVFPCVQGSAHLHIMGAKTFTFKNAMTEEYRECMRQVVKNAKALGEALQEKGFRLVSGGTDNHLLLLDLRSKGLTGARLDQALEKVGITVNKNMIPYDPEKPMVTSGVRIGATAMTIKGMKEKEMREIAHMINTVAENMDNEEVMKDIKRKTAELALKFPMYRTYFQ